MWTYWFMFLVPAVAAAAERTRGHFPGRSAALSVRGLAWVLAALGLGTWEAPAFVLAPVLTPLLFGPGYEDSVAVVRVLSLLPPLLGVGTVLGIHWALPHGFDRIYMRFVLAAGLVNVLLAVLLVPRWGASGMATAAVLAEASVEAGLVWLALREGMRMRRSGVATPG